MCWNGRKRWNGQRRRWNGWRRRNGRRRCWNRWRLALVIHGWLEPSPAELERDKGRTGAFACPKPIEAFYLPLRHRRHPNDRLLCNVGMMLDCLAKKDTASSSASESRNSWHLEMVAMRREKYRSTDHIADLSVVSRSLSMWLNQMRREKYRSTNHIANLSVVSGPLSVWLNQMRREKYRSTH